MKILIVPSWYPTRENPGSGVFFRDQAIALAQAGHQVSILYVRLFSTSYVLRHGLPDVEHYEDTGVSVYIYPACSFGANRKRKVCERIAAVILKAYRYVEKKEGSFDVIHAHSFLGAGYAVCKVKTQIDLPLVVTEHLSSIGNNRLTECEAEHLDYTVKNANTFLCVSNHLKCAVSNVTKGDYSIGVVPNILSNDFFFDRECRKNDIFTFIAAGGLVEIKKFDVLIRAFSKMVKKGESVQLFICGEGNMREELENLISSLHMQDHIFLMGYQSRPELCHLMQRSYCFVHSSRSETFGVVLIEAMACGLPVIGTLNGGSDEVLQTYGAIPVPVGDVEILADRMRYVMEHYEEYDRVQIAENAQEMYGKEAIVRKLENIYRLVIK